MSFQTRRISEKKGASRFLLRPFLKIFIGWIGILTRIVQRRHEEQETQKDYERHTRLLKRVAIIIASLCIAILLFVTVAKALVALRVLSLDTIFSVAGNDLPRDIHGFTNFLLLGEGDSNHDGVDLTDTIMVASVDPRTKSVVLLSLPRDLYLLHTKKMGEGRINSLYRDYKGYLKANEGMREQEASQAAMRELGDEIGRTIDLTVHHIVKVDFIAFVQAVNAIGGVDIDVPYDIIDAEYPGPDYTYETFEIHKGLQHIDGETALKYARSRHTTSDFDRSARQQQLIQALGQKARDSGLASSPGKITSLLRILSAHVETTMSIPEIIGAAKLGRLVDQKNVLSMQLSDRNGLYGSPTDPGGFLYAPPREQFEGMSILLPVSIPEFPVTWKQIRTLSHLLFQNRGLTLSRPHITILNASGIRGLASLLGDELIRYGFTVARTGNAPDKKKLPHAWIAPGSEADESSAQFFGTLLHIAVKPLPEEFNEIAGPVTIILGKDYHYQPIQDLLPASE